MEQTVVLSCTRFQQAGQLNTQIQQSALDGKCLAGYSPEAIG